MAPHALALSPAELSVLRAALAQSPPLRLDVTKGPQDFRSMRAECDVLPAANGSARIALEDGTEALVGVKAEVEKTATSTTTTTTSSSSWLHVSVDVPGFRDDDALPVFLAAMLTESLLATPTLSQRLHINARFHWNLYIDILLLSPPLSYPLALLSMTTHLALLSTRLPALTSERDEDPLFNDDWAAATPLYHASTAAKPPIIVLAIAVDANIILDPAAEELAVADAVLALALTTTPTGPRLLSLRTIDPPSHLTPPGVPNAMNTATGGAAPDTPAHALTMREMLADSAVWTPPRGGMKRALVTHVTKMVLQGGIAEDIIAALAAIAKG